VKKPNIKGPQITHGEKINLTQHNSQRRSTGVKRPRYVYWQYTTSLLIVL